jgi:hypothetical protein
MIFLLPSLPPSTIRRSFLDLAGVTNISGIRYYPHNAPRVGLNYLPRLDSPALETGPKQHANRYEKGGENAGSTTRTSRLQTASMTRCI